MLCFDNFVLSVSQILTSKIYFTITAEILAAHWLFFIANICGQTHEFIIYEMCQQVEADNLSVRYCKKK